jgi:metal-responsive CopG/Arc/MetJ family transcriptional regulator
MLKILKFVIPALLVIAIGVVCYLWYEDKQAYEEEIEILHENYQDEIMVLEEIIAAMGEIIEVYFVTENVRAGTPISSEHLEKRPIPITLFTPQFVLAEPDLLNAFYRINVARNTPLTYSVLRSEMITQQDRYYDIIAHRWPVTLQAGDVIDYRIVTPNGQDFIVFNKKFVHAVNANSITLILNEEEILRYHSAINDVAYYPPTFLYVVQYIEPSFQLPAAAFYPVNSYVLALMEMNPNIPDEVDSASILSWRAAFEEGAQSFLTDQERGIHAQWINETLNRIMTDRIAYLRYLEDQARANEQAQAADPDNSADLGMGG